MKWLVMLGVGAALIAIGCVGSDGSDDKNDGQFEGCGSDLDCRGERICEQGMCVNPDDSSGGSASGTNADGSDASSGDNGATGSGSGSDQATTGDNTSDGEAGSFGSGMTQVAGVSGVFDDPELEQAYIRDCEARHAPNCEMPIGSLDQCMGQCLVVDEINDGYCLDERRAQYNCLADGGYTCVSGYPQPKSTCIAETQALSTCLQESPCRKLCEQLDGTQCAPEGEDCFEACRAEEQGFEDSICSYDYTRLISYWGIQELSCDGDRRSITGCESQVAQIADCIGLHTGECEGFCWGADMIGCAPSDCMETCSPKLDDVDCGFRYRRLLDCTYDSYQALYLECQDGTPVPTEECASEQTEYDSCLETSAAN